MGKKVLVVDDEEDVRDFMRLVLESSGYEVECVADGIEGLHGIEAWEPDLVLLDLMMPAMSGWEMLERVKPRYPPFIVVVSAAIDSPKALGSRISGTIKKPFRPGELIGACRQVLGE
jgi:two-component system, OmpR family, response regulator AdeR